MAVETGTSSNYFEVDITVATTGDSRTGKSEMAEKWMVFKYESGE